jgi:hypothetical protein
MQSLTSRNDNGTRAMELNCTFYGFALSLTGTVNSNKVRLENPSGHHPASFHPGYVLQIFAVAGEELPRSEVRDLQLYDLRNSRL